MDIATRCDREHGRLRRLLACESRLRRPERRTCVLTSADVVRDVSTNRVESRGSPWTCVETTRDRKSRLLSKLGQKSRVVNQLEKRANLRFDSRRLHHS